MAFILNLLGQKKKECEKFYKKSAFSIFKSNYKNHVYISRFIFMTEGLITKDMSLNVLEIYIC